MTDFFSTNTFDLAVYVCLFVAVVMGFMTGLLRGLATIFDYICGIGIAVAVTPKAISLLANYPKIPTPQTWVTFIAIFIAAWCFDQRRVADDRERNGRAQCQRSGSRRGRGTRGHSHCHAGDPAGAGGGRYFHRPRSTACNRFRRRPKTISIV
jgi:hypothetical protein